MTNIKLILSSIITFGVGILYFFFKRTKSENKILKMKVQAQKSQLETQKQINEQKIKNIKLQSEQKNNEIKNLRDKNKRIDEFSNKINNMEEDKWQDIQF